MGSAFTLVVRGAGVVQQDSVSFSNGSLLFTGNNQTVFYVGGKPDNVEASCYISDELQISSSHKWICEASLIRKGFSNLLS